MANFQGFKARKINSTPDGSGLNNYVQGLFDASVQWKDIQWLRSITTLPLVLKGILTAEDARMAASIGVNGILVSNHGARQVDGTPASVNKSRKKCGLTYKSFVDRSVAGSGGSGSRKGGSVS